MASLILFSVVKHHAGAPAQRRRIPCAGANHDKGGNKRNVIAEPSVLPLASLNATPQKEFAITNSFAPTESHILFEKCWPRPHWGCPGTGTETEIGAVLSGGRERERAAPVL